MDKRFVFRPFVNGRSCYVNGVNTNHRAYESFEDAGFEFNEFGHIRSDFASLIESQSVLVMQQAANRLRELRSIQPDTSKMSFDEIVSTIRPRWVQSPKKIMEFEDYLLSKNIEGFESIKAEIEERRRSEAEEKRIEDANKAVAQAVAE